MYQKYKEEVKERSKQILAMLEDSHPEVTDTVIVVLLKKIAMEVVDEAGNQPCAEFLADCYKITNQLGCYL